MEAKLNYKKMGTAIKENEFGQINALLIGSIGSLVETSEIQLESYNKAFIAAGIDWCWSQDEYKKMLCNAGGKRRVVQYAITRGLELSQIEVANIHRKKEEFFAELLGSQAISARPGVGDLLIKCREAGVLVGWITTTSSYNVESIRKALKAQVDFTLFDIITTRDDCKDPKPAPEIYTLALSKLRMTARHALAIEDSSAGVASAKRANLK